MRWPWQRQQWVVVIVGEVTGKVTPIHFLTFSKESEAAKWAERGNLTRNHWNGTHYEIRREETQ